PEPDRGADHDGDLDEFDDADQAMLREAVGELAGGRREQEERQDEHAAAQRNQALRRQPEDGQRLVRDQDHQRVLQQGGVERGEELRPEERREATRSEQRQLAHWLSKNDSSSSGWQALVLTGCCVSKSTICALHWCELKSNGPPPVRQ